MGKESSENRHDELVDILQSELFYSHDYDRFWKFLNYCRNGQVGEVDLLAMADGVYDFYEVKCSFHSKSHEKARYQFDKYKLAFPNQDITGFMYTGDKGLIRL